MLQLFLLVAGAFGAVGGIAGLAALTRVFVVDAKVVKHDDLEAERVENRKLRADLDSEIKARRADRAFSDTEIQSVRTELFNVRQNWDACRAECQRLRALVEGGAT